MRRAAAFLLALVAVPAALQAQRCVGQAPWRSGSLKVGGSLEFGSVAVAGGVGLGKDKGLFGSAGAGVWSSHGFSQFFIEGGLGKELSKPITDKLELCPIANVSYFFPKDQLSEFNLSGGVSLGYPIEMSAKSVSLALIGSGQLGLQHAKSTVCVGTACGSASNTDVVGIFGFGAGFIFNNRISLVPQLVLPTQGGISLLIIANVAVGSKQ